MRPAQIIAVLVFGAAVAVTGCSAHSTASDPAAAAPAATRPAAATSASTPTASRPRTTQPTPAPTSRPPTRPVACRTGQLQLATGVTDSGMGRQWTTYAFQNRSAQACTMSSFPMVRLLNAPGRVIATVPGHDAAPAPWYACGRAGRPISASASSSILPIRASPCPAAATLVVTPPHQGQTLTIPTTLAPCGGRLWSADIHSMP
jgi:Domain of unknown function (DUF4232)